MKGLGKRIKFLRKQRRLTLVQVAERTGIDQSTLSRMENDKIVGPLTSHIKLAEVFGIPLAELYEKVVHQAEEAKERSIRQKVETFSHSSGAVSELLTSAILRKKMMPILLRIKAKGHTETEEFAPLTERFVYVLKNSIEINVNGEKRALGAGESLYFDAHLPHSFRNPSRSEACCLSVMTPASL